MPLKMALRICPSANCRTLTQAITDFPGQMINSLLVLLTLVLASSSFGGLSVYGLPVSRMDQRNTIGCIWRSSISPTMPAEQVFTPRPDCGFGQLWWYDPHPGYILRIHFRYQDSGADFRLCLQHHEKNYVSRVHRQNGTMDTLIKPPDKGKETCLNSEDGSVEMYFEAPSHDVYVTVIQYILREPP